MRKRVRMSNKAGMRKKTRIRKSANTRNMEQG
jgi:hypothetical protein